MSIEYVDRHGTNSLKWDSLNTIYGDPNLLSMWVADMDFASPPCVREALRNAVDHGVFGYATHIKNFKDAFMAWQATRHEQSLEASWIKFAPGVVPALHWCVLAMTQPGDAIAVCSPVYYPFYGAVEDCGRRLVDVPLSHDEIGAYRLDINALEDALATHDVRMLLFCSPHNPVGRVWTTAELEELLQVCRRHHVIVVSDEIHQDFVYGDAKHVPLGTLESQGVVTLTAPSKTFNLAGLHIACVVIADEQLRDQWDALIKQLHISFGNSLGYQAAEAAYRHGAPWLDKVLAHIDSNYRHMRSQLLKTLPRLTIAPLEGTYLMWVDFGSYLRPEDQRTFFVEECKIAIDYGSMFRGDGPTWARFNLATSRDHIDQAIERILWAANNRGWMAESEDR